MGMWDNFKSWWNGDDDKKFGQGEEHRTLEHGGEMRDMAREGWNDAWNRDAPQLGGFSDFRQGQQGLISQLQGVASGEQKGAGEMAMNRQRQQSLAQQVAMRNMARGANAASAARTAATNAGQLSTNFAGMASQAALQDQSAARGLLGQVLGQARGQDQSHAIANLNAQLQARGMDDAARLAYLQQMFGMDAAELNARLQQAQMGMGQRRPGMGSQLMQMGGGILTGLALQNPGGGK